MPAIGHRMHAEKRRMVFSEAVFFCAPFRSSFLYGRLSAATHTRAFVSTRSASCAACTHTSLVSSITDFCTFCKSFFPGILIFMEVVKKCEFFFVQFAEVLHACGNSSRLSGSFIVERFALERRIFSMMWTIDDCTSSTLNSVSSRKLWNVCSAPIIKNEI